MARICPRVCQLCSLCFSVQRHLDYRDVPYKMMQAYFITDIMLDPSEQKVEKHFNCLKYVSDSRSEIIPRKLRQLDTLIKLPRPQWFVVCCNITSKVRDKWWILHCLPWKRGPIRIVMAIYILFWITCKAVSSKRLKKCFSPVLARDRNLHFICRCHRYAL